ncbi:MAG: hypothetical protein IPI45_00235 [Saprospiraceae bacterium]|nr:hypothetical protein [Saprospiraceae bacterium]MBK7736183.1 hypothetical protein [Saprospiraceae bacterium]MBK7912451.1 hypothetical protein [Saprospiraceae bacterium]
MKSILNYTPTCAGHLLRKFDLYVIVLSGVLLFSCKNNPTRSIDSPVQSIAGQTQFEQLPESFRTFYIKFHEDSLFQMEHIVFPLEGLPDHADPEDVQVNPFYYTADQWIIHKLFDSKSNTIVYLELGGIIIEERITEMKYGLTIIRRFANSSSGWRLIYYAGLNKYTIN